MFQFEYLKRVVFQVFYSNILNTAEKITAEINDKNGSCRIELMTLFRSLTLRIIIQATLGLTANENEATIDELSDIYSNIIEELNLRVWHPYRKYLPTVSNWNFSRQIKKLDRIIIKVIEQRRTKYQHREKTEKKEEVDLLDMMLLNFDQETGIQLSNQEILNEVKTYVERKK